MNLSTRIAARAAAGLVLLAALAAPSAGVAVTATVDEARLGDTLGKVYGQGAFGSSPVDVRVAPVTTVGSRELARVTDRSVESAIFDLAATFSPGIALVFVESIDWCSGYDREVVGCALRGAPGLFVEAEFAAGPFGPEMIAHEIGHNLGLFHSDSGLMAPRLNGDLTLTGAEARTVLASALVREDASGRFIDVAPVRIAPIPLPASAQLLAFGALTLLLARRRT
jgi:hypothetical protein